jgi:undecaprenyl-diphosphatase
MPAIIVGFILHDTIKTFLFTPITVLLGLVFGAILMIFAEVKKRNPITHSLDEMTNKQALIIGLFQCLAVYPGFSRAGSTISGGLLVRASYKAASDFSFLIALPIMVGATGLDLFKSWNHLSISDLPMFVVGFSTSFVVALMAVVTFVKWISKIGLIPFALYRFVLAIAFYIFVLY